MVAAKLGLLAGIMIDMPLPIVAELPFFASSQTTGTQPAPPVADAPPGPVKMIGTMARTGQDVATGHEAPASRMASGAGRAMAAEAAPDKAAPAPAPAPAMTESQEREALQQRQEQLNRREQELKQLQDQLDTRLEELQTLEGKLQTMIKEAESLKDQKLRHLVDVYTNMKAKQAAEVLESLDERISVKILAGMRGRTAGEILTFVKAERAARLSEALTRMQLPQD